MKLERAQELYSDYAEGTLTPALSLALEQHFETEAAARADYDDFARLYTLLDAPEADSLPVPAGFRAQILERAAAMQAERNTTFTTRAATTLTGWFHSVPHRRASGGALAAAAAIALVVVLIAHSGPGKQSTNLSSLVPMGTYATNPAVIQNVTTATGTDNNIYHYFQVHLPNNVPGATVNAYAVTATDQITDQANHLDEAVPAVSNQHLTNHQKMQVPIALGRVAPAGMTLNLLVKWTADDPHLGQGAQVVFTPASDPNPAATLPANGNFFDALQTISSRYGMTVVADADAPSTPVTVDFSGDGVQALQSLATQVHETVQPPSSGTYYLAKP